MQPNTNMDNVGTMMPSENHHRFYAMDTHSGGCYPVICKSQAQKFVNAPDKLFVRGVLKDRLISLSELALWNVQESPLNRKAKAAVVDVVETLRLFQVDMECLDAIEALVK